MNLKSLAIALGMSKTTVSRALNGYPEVNSRTREIVLAAAKKVGYRPNPLARSLAVGRSNVLGMIFPLLPNDLGDSVFLSVVNGMSDAVEASKMSLIISPVSPQNELPSYETMVRSHQVDGLVVGRTKVKDERIACLMQAGFPFVAHGRTCTDAPYAYFDYDHDTGIDLAVSFLLAHGHQRIALLSAPQDLHFAYQRKQSFLRCMAQAGLQADPRHLLEQALDRRSGYQAMQQLLAATPRPTAVIVDNHLSGVGAVRALMDAGIAIGKEISVIVWGNVEDSLIGLDVTTIAQPDLRRAGAKMVEMLQSLLAGTPPERLQEIWQPVLLPGATVGRCPD